MVFDYKLRTGRAMTRNAIRLLAMIGYDPKIIEAAQESAKHFEETVCGNKRRTVMLVKIYTDGAARGNPDEREDMAVSCIIPIEMEIFTRKNFPQDIKKTTNNRMELMAAIVGLEALNRPCQIQLYSDSKYLVDAFNQH